VKETPVCPKCRKEIDHLLAVETREVDLVATYDEENDELEFKTVEEWHGNPIGEQISIVFSCPQCKMNLFGSEKQAREFLMSSESAAA